MRSSTASWRGLRRAALLLAVLAASCGVVPAGQAAAARPVRCNHPAEPGITTEHLVVGGTDREYRLSVPASYDGSKPAPLVFNFHGLGSTMDQQAVYSSLEDAAGARGYVVITPQGRGGLVSHWSIPPLDDTKDDVDFVKAMLDTTERSLCIDTDRVYSTGISNGAMLSTVVACRLPGTLAAIPSVAGVNVTRTCARGIPPVSVLAFHGTADPVVPYQGGALLGGTLPFLGALQARPVERAVAQWAAFDGCTSKPRSTQVAGDVERVSYAKCA